jgi:hypothetical protein
LRRDEEKEKLKGKERKSDRRMIKIKIRREQRRWKERKAERR